jgi:hypothetical protein
MKKYICPKDDSKISGCAYYKQLYCPYWGCERWTTWLKEEVHTSHGTAALLQKGEATPDYTLGACNPANFTIFNLSETCWKVEETFGILIYEKKTDLGTLLNFQFIVIIPSYQVFRSFYEAIQSEFPISVTTKYLFLSLAESITQTLNVILCYVCGGIKNGRPLAMGDKKAKPTRTL